MTVADAVERPVAVEEYGHQPVLDFWEYVHERERIRGLKESGAPRPWTDNLVLQSRFFTNCFREDDPGTKVALEIMSRDRPRNERFWNLLLYRRFNREDVYRESVGYVPFDNDFEARVASLYETLRARKDAGGAVFTDAYQNFPLVQLREQGDVLRRAMYALWTDLEKVDGLVAALESSAGIRHCFELIQKAKMPGIAKFFSWQLTLDCRYGPDPIVPHSDDEWAPVQAGSATGVILWHNWPARGVVPIAAASKSGKSAKAQKKAVESGVRLFDKVPGPECEALMRQMRDDQDDEFSRRDLDFAAVSGGRRMTLASLEHSLCECQKYWNAARGLPSARRAFDGAE